VTDAPTVFHSDRGIQYASKSFMRMLAENGIVGSMSKSGCPFDNAVAESFFSSAKRECIHHRDYRDLEEVKRDVFSYIELFSRTVIRDESHSRKSTQATMSVVPYRYGKTTYRARFVGSGPYRASSSANVVVTPKVRVTAPAAVSTVRKGVAFTASGYLSPAHTTGSRPVRVYRYKYYSGHWVDYGWVTATARTYSSATSRYVASVTLPSTGTWRLRACAPPDSLHAESWSPGYDTVRAY